MKRRLRALTLVCVMILAACGGGSGDETIEGQDVTVKMYDNRYQYTEVHVPVGGTVTFVGAGANPHNAVAADDSWSTVAVTGSNEMHEGDEAVITYDKPGRYVFFCTFHGNAQGAGMAGVLVVGEDE